MNGCCEHPEITLMEQDCGLTAHLQGDISIRNAASVHETLLAAWKGKPANTELVVDMERTRRIDSSGVGALMELVSDGVPVSLCNLQESPRRLLERTGLSNLFRIYPRAEEVG